MGIKIEVKELIQNLHDNVTTNNSVRVVKRGINTLKKLSKIDGYRNIFVNLNLPLEDRQK